MRCRSHHIDRSQPESRSSLSIAIALFLGLLATLVVGSGCSEEAAETSKKGDSGPDPIHVEAVEVRPQEFVHQVALTGQLNAEYEVLLRPEYEGIVESFHAQEGQKVTKGDVLFRMRNGEQEARLREARAEVDLAQDVYERTQRLSKEDISSRARRAEARAALEIAHARLDRAEVALDRTVIRAPFDGVLGSLMVSPGARLDERDGFITLSAIDRLQVAFTLQEMGVPIARVGAQIQVRVIAFPEEKFPGEVFYVAPSIDPSTRRLILKAWVPNSEHRLKPGMFANVDVEVSRDADALVLPESAMVYDRHGVFVWRVDGGGKAEKVPVKLGLRQGGRIEVLEGVEPGDWVVTAGTNKVLAGRELAFDRGPEGAATTVHAKEPARKVGEGAAGAES